MSTPGIDGGPPGFTMPAFVRLSWASAAAESAWGMTIRAIGGAVSEVMWLSVADGLRACAMIRISESDLVIQREKWRARGLAERTLAKAAPAVEAWWLNIDLARRADAQLVVVAHDKHLETFERAYRGDDHEAMGALLGYPKCCRAFFQEVVVRQICRDTVWAMSQAYDNLDGATRCIGPGTGNDSNILLQALGLRAVPHCPCHWACANTLKLGRGFAESAERNHLGKEFAKLREMLSWPVEWSALHGIAEVQSPIFKLCTPTDPTAARRALRLEGSSLPPEAARGLGFAFRKHRALAQRP